MRFHATLELNGRTATGIEVPAEVVEALGGGKRPAVTASFAGHRYGTPREPVTRCIAAGVTALLEIDIAGARQVRRAVPDALLVFLAPPSWDELVRRLSARGTEPPEVIARRLELAAEEIEAGQEFDITLVNTSVKDVCEQLVALMAA